MKSVLSVAATAALLVLCRPLAAAPSQGEEQFRELYKELVETNTTLSSATARWPPSAWPRASRPPASRRRPAHLHRAGSPEGRRPGRDLSGARPEAQGDSAAGPHRRGRGQARGLDARPVHAGRGERLLLRARRLGRQGRGGDLGRHADPPAHREVPPARTLKLALTCGEETAGAFNGAQWLTENRRELIDAEFALNEGAAGELDASGKRVALQIQAGEKTSQNFRLEVTNPGGHSSRPVKDNAIYHLAAALTRIEAYDFPAQFNDGNRGLLHRAWRRSRRPRARRRSRPP